ncbi:hypothetical protein JOC94_001386 [Bacillus thermophilus]|uniref:Uncharacterized protein n=1 Tax=Siminovitchia thermophila TaxID=1245522 RepID=A0ABS2R5I7_9BACI|nr:hypothetical protein [Siminovitchia thermophila]
MESSWLHVPLAKKFSITTAEALGSAILKYPHVSVVTPHMQLYIDIPIQISKIDLLVESCKTNENIDSKFKYDKPY